MTVYSVISLPKNTVYTACIGFWPTLLIGVRMASCVGHEDNGEAVYLGLARTVYVRMLNEITAQNTVYTWYTIYTLYIRYTHFTHAIRTVYGSGKTY
jgi:hypothetical protein